VYEEVLRSLGAELSHVCLNASKMRALCVKGFFELCVAMFLHAVKTCNVVRRYPNWGRVMPHLVLRKVRLSWVMACAIACRRTWLFLLQTWLQRFGLLRAKCNRFRLLF
jgi:hypothetical protein